MKPWPELSRASTRAFRCTIRMRGPEHIVGVLYYKDLMRWMRLRLSNLGQSTSTRISRMQIGQIMHDVLVVPETKGPGGIAGRVQRTPPPSGGRGRRI